LNLQPKAITLLLIGFISCFLGDNIDKRRQQSLICYFSNNFKDKAGKMLMKTDKYKETGLKGFNLKWVTV